MEQPSNISGPRRARWEWRLYPYAPFRWIPRIAIWRKPLREVLHHFTPGAFEVRWAHLWVVVTWRRWYLVCWRFRVLRGEEIPWHDYREPQ